MEPTTSPVSADDALYAALLSRSSEYEGLAFVGVRTTGIFCRLTCAAKKPRRENCEFFRDVRSAMVAGYRACLRCRPLEARASPPVLSRLMDAVEREPHRRWRSAGARGPANRAVRPLGGDPAGADAGAGR